MLSAARMIKADYIALELGVMAESMDNQKVS